MTEDRTGRELTPADESAVTPVSQGGAVDRFAAPPAAHTIGLTEERAAQVVQQSGRARMVAFLAVLIVALFIPIYWFYDIGVPALGVQSRMDKEANAQMVSDVEQGYALFLANCARCHSSASNPGDGKGGIGPPLNDQGKLYNAVTAQGLPGTGHLNPNYINNVLTVGGRYVCGDANSVMPVWLQPGGPLNYRQVQEIIAWLTASSDVQFQYVPAQAETGTGPAPTAQNVQGWRDPNFTPGPDATAVPACWRNPSGQIGGTTGGSTASAAPISSPGTAAHPRVIQLVETSSLTITDPDGKPVSAIPVQPGEVISFEITNKAGFDHNFWVGLGTALSGGDTTNAVGVPAFSSGTQTFTYNVPDQSTPGLQFGCTLPGHFSTMHGDVVLVGSTNGAGGVAVGGAGAAAPSPAPSGEAASPAPTASPAPIASTAAATGAPASAGASAAP
jgi:mono/diheme cytochrome c family protein